MRTNIDIDDDLMSQAMAATGATTKREAVDRALRQVVRAERQLRALRGVRGLGWEGDLDEMRTDKPRASVE